MEVPNNTGIIRPEPISCAHLIPFEMIGLMRLDTSQYFTLTYDIDRFNWSYPSSAFWPYNIRKGYWNERLRGKNSKRKTPIRRCHPYYNLAFMNIVHKTKEHEEPIEVPLDLGKRPAVSKFGVPHCTYPTAVKIAISASTVMGLTTNEICTWLRENVKIFQDYEVKRASVVSELRQSRRGTQYICDKGRWKLRKYHNTETTQQTEKGNSPPVRVEYSHPIWRFN